MIVELPIVRLLARVLKFLYDFRQEGSINLPSSGPLIILYAEYSPLCSVYNAVGTGALLSKKSAGSEVLIFLAEELFALPYFHSRHLSSFLKVLPLNPKGAGRYSLSLLDALEHLKTGGIIIINPDGDMSRDGRPLPVQGGAAWLGLHSAAPLLPIAATAGTYDTWPPWKLIPYARGRAQLRIGEPFRLAASPPARTTDEDLKTGIAKIGSEMNSLRFGPGGPKAWAGPGLGEGNRAGGPIRPTRSWQPAAPLIHSAAPAWKQGIALLLWRCPMCRSEGSLMQKSRLFSPHALHCRACGAEWDVRRIRGKDFRLKAVRGSPPYLGLDGALSDWYDEIKKGFIPSPLFWSEKGALPQEKAYLRTEKVRLLIDRSNSLGSGWPGRKPPEKEIPVRAGNWRRLGPGKLTLTNRRFIWESSEGSLDFLLPRVKAIHLRSYYLLSLGYGVTPYRFMFLRESALRWLTYAGELIKSGIAETAPGQTIKISHY